MSRTLEQPMPKPKPLEAEKPKKKESNRDLVEQIVIAFILAFMIRGFAVEAFVIPTGSMAPTLYGQHKEVTCPQCGQVFAVNAAQEVDENRAAPPMVSAATCINCRFRVTNLQESPSFKGDRILVMKFLYNLPKWLGGLNPKRWDVVVFHYPEEPETNYIKRLIGLPDETVRVYFGDILTRANSADADVPFEIQRKPLSQQQAMQQMVWNDQNRPRSFSDKPEWNRWQSGDAAQPWTEISPATYQVKASPEWKAIGYRNLIPTPAQWDAAIAGTPVPGPVRPTLITDFYGYNSGSTTMYPKDTRWFQPHWVGDLTVSGAIKVKSGENGVLRMELIEGGTPHHCEIDLATGVATLKRDGKVIGEPSATSLKADGASHDFAFANVDDRLTLWVDGATPFGDGVSYKGEELHPAPTAADLKPVNIAVKGAEAELTGLALKRDLYYTRYPNSSDYDGSDIRWPSSDDDRVRRVADVLEILGDPAMFPALGSLKSTDYPIAPGRYMMMGDNSPMSKDGRAWGSQDTRGYFDNNRRADVEPWANPQDRDRWEVPQEFLIGKAFFVFWPHGVPLWPNLGVPLPPNFRPSRDLRFPFRPYVERMKWIR